MVFLRKFFIEFLVFSVFLGGGIGEFFTPIGVSRGFHLGFWDRGFSRYLLHFSAVVIRLLEVLGVQEVLFFVGCL